MLIKLLTFSLLILSNFFPVVSLANEKINIPILVYHNLNPVKPGSMNLTPKKVEAQIKWIIENGYQIITLREAVNYLTGKITSLPKKSIVITADDGWQADYQYLYPIVVKYKIPVTLFIYPSTISEGRHALTWGELKTLQSTGLFNIESHTFTHPNFKQMKKRLSPVKYYEFVRKELINSKKILEEKLNTKVTLLAWPFGIYDKFLEGEAKKAGYEMAFTIDALPANRQFKSMAQPRYMIVDALTTNTFLNIIKKAK